MSVLICANRAMNFLETVILNVFYYVAELPDIFIFYEYINRKQVKVLGLVY